MFAMSYTRYIQMCIANLVEPGDKVLVGVAGIWGERVADMTRRFRGTLQTHRHTHTHTHRERDTHTRALSLPALAVRGLNTRWGQRSQ